MHAHLLRFNFGTDRMVMCIRLITTRKASKMAHRYESQLNEDIWNNILLHQNELLHTAKGLPFTYAIKTLPDGTVGNEIVVSRRSKTITRATVDKAYQKVMELGAVKGPKQLGVFGAPYLFVIFKVIGVIKEIGVVNEDSVIEEAEN